MSSKTIEDMVDGLDKADAEWLYEIANKARAEEAELFWKRANYFWLFVAADLATYGLLWRLADGKINPWQYRMLVAGLGLVGTFCWVLAIMGSRWVFHKWLGIVQIVERRVTPLPLYREASEYGARMLNEVPAWHRFSSTRLAIFFGLVMCLVWGALMVLEMIDGPSLGLDKVHFGAFALLAVFLVCLLAYQTTGRRRT